MGTPGPPVHSVPPPVTLNTIGSGKTDTVLMADVVIQPVCKWVATI